MGRGERDDDEWILRPDPCVELWKARSLDLGQDLTLLHLGGHFAGGANAALAGGNALLSGDVVQVVMDRR